MSLRSLPRQLSKLSSYRLQARDLGHFPCTYSTDTGKDTVASCLSEPSWSVKTLIPDPAQEPKTATVTPKQLHHLLRLSALPQPSSKAEEEEMLKTLESQIHFVKEVQSIDTTDVAPLRSICDESAEAREENTIHLSDLKEALSKERTVGRNRRIERTASEQTHVPDEGIWDGNALGSASKTMGKYFVVQSS
jgi:Asp-tRNA(Asn)/Glu-tRNA(Gln) amidotransferase C subunit